MRMNVKKSFKMILLHQSRLYSIMPKRSDVTTPRTNEDEFSIVESLKMKEKMDKELEGKLL